jgi:hypothetical protein
MRFCTKSVQPHEHGRGREAPEAGRG